jgi:hypothetical protein
MTRYKDFIDIKVSVKNCMTPFNGCQTDYILNICKGCCCDSHGTTNGCLIGVVPEEEEGIKKLGFDIIDGYIQPLKGKKGCPFKLESGFCELHNKPEKPIGCIFSPFTLNDNNTLIVKNRNRRLRCYNAEPKIPAYKSYKFSLITMFGEDEANRITKLLDSGSGDFFAKMPIKIYNTLKIIRDRNRKSVNSTNDGFLGELCQGL